MFDQTNTLAGGDTIAMPSVAADETAVMTLTLSNSAVTETYRDGNDLILVLAGGQEVRVEGFYTADGSQLLIQDAETGAVVQVAVTETGALIGLEPRSLAQLEQMFGTDVAVQVAGEAPVDLTADMSTQGAVAAGGALAAPGAIATAGIVGTTTLMMGAAVVAANDDDDNTISNSEAVLRAVADIVADPETTTAAEFANAGIEGVTDENLSDVQSTIAATADIVDTPEKFQNIVDTTAEIISFDTANADATITSSTLNADGDLVVTTDAGSTIIVELDENLNAIKRSEDRDGNGTIDSVVEYGLDENGNIVQETSRDPVTNAIIDDVTFILNEDGFRIGYTRDSGGDGDIDSFATLTQLNAQGNTELLFIDSVSDGNININDASVDPDTVIKIVHDETSVNNAYQYHALLDRSPVSGTDFTFTTFRQRDVEVSSYTFTVADMENAAFTTMNLDNESTQTYVISDAVLTELHGNNGGTALTIQGNVGDTIDIGAGISQDASLDTTDGLLGYQGSIGTMLIDPEITVI